MPTVLRKYVADVRAFGFDFSKEPEFLRLGDSISSAVIAIESGGAALTIGAPSINNNTFIVTALMSAGTSGVNYELSCKVTTAAAKTIKHYGTLQVL
jgi:hypothetical protein